SADDRAHDVREVDSVDVVVARPDRDSGSRRRQLASDRDGRRALLTVLGKGLSERRSFIPHVQQIAIDADAGYPGWPGACRVELSGRHGRVLDIAVRRKRAVLLVD